MRRFFNAQRRYSETNVEGIGAVPLRTVSTRSAQNGLCVGRTDLCLRGTGSSEDSAQLEDAILGRTGVLRHVISGFCSSERHNSERNVKGVETISLRTACMRSAQNGVSCQAL